MKKLYPLFMVLLFHGIAYSQENQEEKKEPLIKFSGHIRFESYFDSYESTSTRNGDVYIFPNRQKLDVNGNDINEHGQFTMISSESKFRARLSGPDAFGAKVSGLAEVDFLGKAFTTKSGDVVDFTQTPVLRHMFMNLDWGKTQLLMGQYWHPVFLPECYPEVLSFGSALPFNPLNRSAQIKASYKITDAVEIAVAALSHYDFVSKGPIDAQKNAVMPDLHGSLKYKTDLFTAGIVAGYKLLKPRLTTVDKIITNETIGSFDVVGFGKIKMDNLTLKLYGMYGQNLTSYVMLGGYGASQDSALVDDFSYSNINTLAIWGEGIYKLDALTFGLFGGYTSNLGASTNEYYDYGYTLGGNIESMYRISPRVSYTSGKIELGLEYMLTSAVYMDLNTTDHKYEALTTDDAVSNHRLQFSARYTF
ncbi:MAG TPA: hypothetical protein DCQ26_07010 [Marinilabiliales bacterium]|nr:MAG: hypothetical protein A2W84_01365 [Bacteroidetes bacterium GWC2_40_13]OFX71787.1 MAG: hypothetical protein A2W96_06015 [Bacteroidetes bacterium GWD2_40_43]OFX94584.1 MAG: hypothetical protein A2W97_17820 [Bacteroidetes bacterium GWE2_40_63]OFY22451.1 MAG: hypothetical protein A2W88_07920 [Bacteroidetes bacterium GWF2_40_13]OFZ24351.1 MAG: hypothetical protein A2437_17950 [Bacteroidetes bacterium RIFOXYC2_FULL_40_12]HAM98345.1 hypothetical protein [Marinilabiliales bacterium]